MPSIKSTLPSPLFQQEYATEKCQFSTTTEMSTYVCVFCFSSLVSTGPQTCSLVWYVSKKGLASNLMLHTGHLNYVAAVFSGTHMAPNFITFQKPVFVVCVKSFLDDWWNGLVFFVLWSEVKANFCLSCLVPHQCQSAQLVW